jgi:hypothetical protein
MSFAFLATHAKNQTEKSGDFKKIKNLGIWFLENQMFF